MTSLSKVLHRMASGEPRIVGLERGDFQLTKRGENCLTAEFTEIRTEVAVDGTRYVPIKEVVKFSEYIQTSHDTGYKLGFEQGKAQGTKEGRAAAQKVFDEFKGVIDSVVNQRESLIREAELNIQELIFKIAHKLTFDAAEINPNVCAQVVKGAIESLSDKREIYVTVHPDHLSRMRELMDDFKALSTDMRELTFESDPHVGYGGCFIRTPSGDIDARLESQFAIIEESLRDD